MHKLRAGLSVALIAGIQAVALIVSAPAAQAWQTPVAPDAPPRVTAPAPTTFKPPTTAVVPKDIMKRAPIGLALALDPIVTGWLQGLIGNIPRSDGILGCTNMQGKITAPPPGGAPCPSGEKQETAPSNGLVVPDTLWGAITGKDLNPLLEGAAPENWSTSQAKPAFDVPANGKPGWLAMSFTGKPGALCAAHPTWYTCWSATGWKDDIASWGNSQFKAKVRCKLVSTGAVLGAWNGSGNNALGSVTGFGNLVADKRDYQACRDDGSQVIEFVKALPVPAAYEFSNSWAPGVWVNPNAEIYKDTTFTANLTCKNGSGGTVTVSKTGAAGTGIIPTVQCPAGYLPDSGNTSVGSAFLDAPTKIEEWQITPETREAFPDCIGWQSLGCIMRVELDGVDCTPGNPACYDWAEIFRLQPSRVKCKWGSYTLDMSNCLALRNAYQSESGISSAPNQAPGAAPLSRDVFGNPVQPNADPASPPSWQPDYGTPSNPAPGPGAGDSPLTNPVPIPGYPAPPGAPAPGTPPVTTAPSVGDTNCWPGGTAAFNPLEWVLQPVKCALTWAFVPQQATAQAQLTRIQGSLGKVPVVASIGTVTTTVNTLGAAAGNGTGCTGPTFNFDFNEVHQEVQPFNACAEPVATMATVSRSLTTVVVIVLGVLAAARAFGASMGFNFTMGKGGGA